MGQQTMLLPKGIDRRDTGGVVLGFHLIERPSIRGKNWLSSTQA
jgi:hypothetical protein